MASAPSIQIESYFDKPTFNWTHLLIDEDTRQCAVVDSVRNFDQKSGRTSNESVDLVCDRIQAYGGTLQWILETHVHADHLSGASLLKQRLGGKIGIGSKVTAAQIGFSKIFNLEKEFPTDGSQFDHLFSDGETFHIGNTPVDVVATPGHTPACITYVVKSSDRWAAFVGDTIFLPEFGTARCDFPGGSAKTLYHSIQKILNLPKDTVLYMCHDYPPVPDGRWQPKATCTVADQVNGNIHVKAGTSEETFVELRTARDKTLEMPQLILPSVQVNVRAGEFPPAESNGIQYLKTPLNAL